MLSAMSVSELQFAVVTDDVKSITKANGVGTKGAQRIIMELKDKMKMEDLISRVPMIDRLLRRLRQAVSQMR